MLRSQQKELFSHVSDAASQVEAFEPILKKNCDEMLSALLTSFTGCDQVD